MHLAFVLAKNWLLKEKGPPFNGPLKLHNKILLFGFSENEQGARRVAANAFIKHHNIQRVIGVAKELGILHRHLKSSSQNLGPNNIRVGPVKGFRYLPAVARGSVMNFNDIHPARLQKIENRG